MRKFEQHPSNCPIARTMHYIGGKWKPFILARLVVGRMRFGRLAVQVPSISRKILSQQLKELEADGLVIRYSYAEKPPRVEYELSDLGKTVIPVLTAMTEWAAQIEDAGIAS